MGSGRATKAGVSASSFLSLKADLAERKARAGSSSTAVTRHVKSSEDDDISPAGKKSLPVELRPSAEVLARRYEPGRGLVEGSSLSKGAKSRKRGRDGKRKSSISTTSSWANTPSAELERSRAALERKALMYEKLRKGKHGGLDRQLLDDGLIDWDRKAIEEGGSSSDSEGSDASDSDSVSGDRKAELQDDPVIEYVDDFGRTRTAKRSDVPRHLLPEEQEKEKPVDESLVHYGPSIAFPVYRPPSPELAQKKAKLLSDPKIDRFDGRQEVRNRGAGFFQFSADETVRRKQMEQLAAERRTTESARQESPDHQPSKPQGPDFDPFAAVEAAGKSKLNADAYESRPTGPSGSQPGNSPQPEKAVATKSLSAAQRRLADRRAEVEAKRRKLLGDEEYERRQREMQDLRVTNFLDGIVLPSQASGSSSTDTSKG